MNIYYAEIIADTGVAALPVGAIVQIELFHHVSFVAAPPTLTVRGPAGSVEISSRCARLLTTAQAKRLRVERKRQARLNLEDAGF